MTFILKCCSQFVSPRAALATLLFIFKVEHSPNVDLLPMKNRHAAKILTCFLWHLSHALMLLLPYSHPAMQLKCRCKTETSQEVWSSMGSLCHVFVGCARVSTRKNKTQNCSLSYSNQTEAYLSDSSVVPILPITSHAWIQAEEEGEPCKQNGGMKKKKNKNEAQVRERTLDQW